MIHTLQGIDQAHAYFTECQLATLFHMAMTKSTAKSALQRQRSICLKMLEWVDVDAATHIYRDSGRVIELIKTANGHPEGISGAIDQEISRCTALQYSKKKS
jgi:hypothetical protein